MKSNVKSYCLLVLATLLWGLSAVCGRVLKDSMSPCTITSLRFFFAALILFLLMYAKDGKKAFYLKKHDAYILIIMGIFGIFLHNVLFFWGLKYTYASNAAIIEAIGPTITSLLAFLFIGERLSKLGWLGLLISFTGAIYLVTNGSLLEILKMNIAKADLAIIACEFFWSSYIVLSWKLSKAVDGLAVTAWTALVGAIMSAITGFAFGEMAIYQFNLHYLTAFVTLTLLAGVVAFLAWNSAISRVGASKGGTFIYLIPIFGAIFGFVFLGETINPHKIIGAIIVVLGMLFCMRAKTQIKSRKSLDEIKAKVIAENKLN